MEEEACITEATGIGRQVAGREVMFFTDSPFEEPVPLKREGQGDV